MTKGGMRPGDALILTKPIGTGTLFAAHARLHGTRPLDRCGTGIDASSNRAAMPCLIAHGATACTDLTGFGLLGHLVEMTRPSAVDAELDLDALPLLDGAGRNRGCRHSQLAAAGQRAPAPRPAQSGRSAETPELPAAVRPADRGRPARQRALC
jgi:thiamine monophosphate kinase